MASIQKTYDLEDRCFRFAQDCRRLTLLLKSNQIAAEDCRQLLKSSGSIGANYIEANERLGKKDFIHRLKIAKKEAKESRYWLKMLKLYLPENNNSNDLIQESTELMNILGAIIIKCS